MTYPQAIQFLESLINYEKISLYPYKESLKLERVKGFLETIGNPQDALRCVHIAGTKGKGSTCAYIAYILREAGFKAGLYTSPHLSDFRERIRILRPHRVSGALRPDFEGKISQKELARLVERLRPAISRYNKYSKCGALSFFEVYTSLAFVYFKEKKVDFAVLETGLGGRLDATNVVFPLVSAITPISYEHTQKLGNTLKEIASEKAGIIKNYKLQITNYKSTVISAPQAKEAMAVIKNRCRQVNARLYAVGKNIIYKKGAKGFYIKGVFGEYPDLKVRLLGNHQLVNAAVAVGVIEALGLCDINIGKGAVKRGLYNTRWPGRCEVVSKRPLVVLDGAQNAASSKAIKEAVRGNFQYRRLILILGISKDKDIKGVCGELSGLADEVVLTQAANPRAASAKELARYLKEKPLYITNSMAEAKELAYSIAKDKDLILAAGSLFVAGEMRDLCDD